MKGSFENYYEFSNVGIDSIDVLYGYGHRAELEKAGEDFIVNTVVDIEKILL